MVLSFLVVYLELPEIGWQIKEHKKKLMVGLEYYVQHYRGLVRQIKWRLMHRRA